jgi:negative regulator of sigma E activity
VRGRTTDIRETADRMIARYGRDAWRVARDTLRLQDVDSPTFDFWLAVSDAIEARRSHLIAA